MEIDPEDDQPAHPVEEVTEGPRSSLDRRSFLTAGAAVLGALGLGGALAACGHSTGGGAGGGSTAKASGTVGSKPAGNGTYVEVSALGNLPYFYDHKLGLQYAGKWLGVSTKYVSQASLDLSTLVSDIQSAVAQKVSGLMVVGFDPSLAPAIDQAVAAGIPTVTLDSDVPNSKRECFLGTGNVEAGVLGGTELAKLVGGAGKKVALVTKTGQDNLNLRVQGYQQALGKAGVHVVSVLNDNSDPGTAASVVSAELRRTPDLDGVGCVEAAGGAGAATAVREAGRTGRVKIVSMDRDAETLSAIQKGQIQASVAQKTALMPFLGVVLCHMSRTLNIPITNDNVAAAISELPANVDTGAQLVTKENVQYWVRKS